MSAKAATHTDHEWRSGLPVAAAPDSQMRQERIGLRNRWFSSCHPSSRRHRAGGYLRTAATAAQSGDVSLVENLVKIERMGTHPCDLPQGQQWEFLQVRTRESKQDHTTLLGLINFGSQVSDAVSPTVWCLEPSLPGGWGRRCMSWPLLDGPGGDPAGLGVAAGSPVNS